MDDIPDVPLENFGADTEVATPPVADQPSGDDKQTTQPEPDATGSEDKEQPETKKAEPEAKDNPKAEEKESGRPEKKDRLQGRFGELTGKIKERDAKIEEYEAMFARTQAMQGITPLKPDDEGQYSVEAIQQNQTQVARAEASAAVSALRMQMEREQVANRMDAEGTEIEKLLDDKGLSDNTIHADNIRAEIEDRLALAQYNPEALKQISAKKIAERYIKGIESERRLATTRTAQNVQTLQDEQAVTPNAPSTPDADSDAAIEARLADIKF